MRCKQIKQEIFDLTIKMLEAINELKEVKAGIIHLKRELQKHECDCKNRIGSAVHFGNHGLYKKVKKQ